MNIFDAESQMKKFSLCDGVTEDIIIKGKCHGHNHYMSMVFILATHPPYIPGSQSR